MFCNITFMLTEKYLYINFDGYSASERIRPSLKSRPRDGSSLQPYASKSLPPGEEDILAKGRRHSLEISKWLYDAMLPLNQQPKSLPIIQICMILGFTKSSTSNLSWYDNWGSNFSLIALATFEIPCIMYKMSTNNASLKEIDEDSCAPSRAPTSTLSYLKRERGIGR